MDDLMLSLLDDVRMEDLSDESLEIVDLLGMDTFKALVCNYGGSEPYIPRLESVVLNARNRRIKAEYNGSNENYLTRKYRISARYIRELAKGKR